MASGRGTATAGAAVIAAIGAGLTAVGAARTKPVFGISPDTWLATGLLVLCAALLLVVLTLGHYGWERATYVDLASSEHVKELVNCADRLAGNVGKATVCQYGEDHIRSAFRAHYPHLAKQLDAWDMGITSDLKTLQDFHVEIEQEASSVGIIPPLFDNTTVVSAVYQVLVSRADRGCLDDSSHPFALFDLGNNAVTMSGVTHAVISASDAAELDQAVLKVFALFYFWLGHPHTQALALRHDSWNSKQGPLVTELQRVGELRTIPKVKRCQLCRPTPRRPRLPRAGRL
jgi:hypothetical protein